ncbi:MAG: hypothetical protein QM756_24110 [Polyangiaceae bacterium]
MGRRRAGRRELILGLEPSPEGVRVTFFGEPPPPAGERFAFFDGFAKPSASSSGVQSPRSSSAAVRAARL